jgi:hypothetical protein
LLPARRVTRRRFDLQDVGAELGEPPRRRRARQADGRIDHHDAGEHATRCLSHCTVPFVAFPADVLRCSQLDPSAIF